MPKTTINEVDNSRYAPSYTQAPMTVLVPGTASFGPIAALENSILVPFSGGESITDFYSKFGTSPARYVSPGTNALLGVTGDNSFEYASNLIRSGAKVLFVRLNQGSYASCPIGDSGFDIQAKYTGRFGNNIACRFEKYSRFDANAITCIPCLASFWAFIFIFFINSSVKGLCSSFILAVEQPFKTSSNAPLVIVL